jgi:cytochrome P450
MTAVDGLAVEPASPAPVVDREVVREAGAPLLGVLPRLLTDAPGFLSRVSLAHPGELVAVRLGPIWMYLIHQPEHVQHVLVDNARNFTKGRMWDATKALFGNGLLRSEGDLWRRQRRMMQPLFNARHLGSLVDIMVDVIDREADRLSRNPTAGLPLEMNGAMTSLTQRILLQTMFGATITSEEADQLGHRLVDALRVINLKVFLFFLPDGFPLPGSARLRAAVRAIDAAMLELVAHRRAAADRPHDLLSLLLQAHDEESQQGMDDRQLRDELVNLFVAGNDTTANGLTFFWYLLATHPEVERRVRAEVDQVLGGRRPTQDDLPRLEYTRMAFQEAMRLYPPVWMFPRFCVKDDVVAGYRIPGGSPVLVLPWLAHRDPRLWDDPDAFVPDRFLPAHSSKRPRWSYLPFGGGARQCIGSAFAMIEAPLIIARFLQSFRFRLVPGYRFQAASTSTLKPKGGLPMLVDRLQTHS